MTESAQVKPLPGEKVLDLNPRLAAKKKTKKKAPKPSKWPRDRLTNELALDPKFNTGKLEIVPCGEVKNLYLRVTPDGYRSWVWIGRIPGIGQRTATLGPVTGGVGGKPKMLISKAWEELKECTRLQLAGIDPSKRAQKKAAANARASQKTFKQAFDEMVATRQEGSEPYGQLTVTNYNTSMNHMQEWWDLEWCSITRPMVTELFKRVRDAGKVSANGKRRVGGGPYAANQCMDVLSAVWNHHFGIQEVDSHGKAIGGCPVITLTSQKLKAKKRRSNRIIPLQFLKIWWDSIAAVEVEGQPYSTSLTWGRYFHTMFYAGCRRTEWTKLRWDECDLTSPLPTITLPASKPSQRMRRTKNKQKHVLPVPPELKELLLEQQRLQKREKIETPWVFTFPDGELLNSPDTVVRKHIPMYRKLIVAAGGTEAEADWSCHDTRRTYTTIARTKAGADEEMRGYLLNHKGMRPGSEEENFKQEFSGRVTRGYTIIGCEDARPYQLKIAQEITKLVRPKGSRKGAKPAQA